MKTSARFILEDARITRVKELPKVCFLSVMVQAGKYADYHEVVLFQPPSFPLVEGEAVTVLGDVQKKKPKDGGREWTIELIGREVKRGDDAKAPRPRRSTEAPSGGKTFNQREAVDPDDGIPF